MSLLARLKHVAIELAAKGTLEIVRGYLLEKLKPVKAQHLYQAIQEDADPWKYAPRQMRSRGVRFARKLRKHRHRLTPALVLKWLNKDRPDLGSLIVNMGPPGKRWLVRWTGRIKERLWPQREIKLEIVDDAEGGATDEAPREAEEAAARHKPDEQEVRWG